MPAVKVDFRPGSGPMTFAVLVLAGPTTPTASFCPSTRRGDPGGYTAYFQQNADGSYSLLS